MNLRLSSVYTFCKNLICTWAIMRITSLHSMNGVAFLFFLLCHILGKTVEKELDQATHSGHSIRKKSAVLLSALFTLFYLSDTFGDIVQDLDQPLFQGCILILTALGLFFLFLNALLYIGCLSLRLPPLTRTGPGRIQSYLPVLHLFLCLICRLPFLLYSWPGILTPDSINQFEQVIGRQEFSNHHPWVHTMTIGLFYRLGTLFTASVNSAFAFYTLFQILFMALAVSYLIWVVGKFTSSLLLPLGIMAFYLLLPYHSVMAICIWKDVLFSGSLLFFCTSLYHLLRESIKDGALLPRSSFVIYLLSACLMCLYRSNGWYAFLLSLPFLLAGFWKKKKLWLPVHLFIILTVLLIKGPVMNHYGVKQPDFVESLSIPLQQVCRVIAVGEELTPEQKEQLNKVMDISYVEELYTEYISDNMKELVRAGNPAYLEEHKLDYLKLWLQLGLSHPGIYLDAYIEQTRGYYSPAAVYPVADVEGVIENDTGLSGEYLIGGRFLLKLREILMKLHTIIPLYGSLWNMGFILWLVLLFLYLKLHLSSSFRTCLPWVPNLAVTATLLIATPVATEFRYAYHLIYCLPLYGAILFLSRKENG